MTTYILKTVICSGLLISIYLLILEKEKMHLFNRFYLLFSIVFSFLVPLITLKTKIAEPVFFESVTTSPFNIHSTAIQQHESIFQSSFLFSDFLLSAYLIITAFLLARFLINLYKMMVKIGNSGTINYNGSRIVLTGENVTPHSFLNYIIVNGVEYRAGLIEEEILRHELAHVRQRHSFDILFMEIVLVFAWINPLLILYKRGVQLNHEFMADDYVSRSIDDNFSYQMLLVNKVTHSVRLPFVSPFNYLEIKKRLIMMRKKTSFKSAILKQVALIPLCALIAVLFASRTVAQEQTSAITQTTEAQQGVTQALLDEYEAILKKYVRVLSDGNKAQMLMMSQEDNDRLEAIFLQMSKEQQDKQEIVFVPRSSIYLTKTVPTQEQIESFRDPKIYGVWIDGKRANNEELGKYVNTDFSHVSVSRLLGNATNYGKHEYQVDLMTNNAYQDHYDKAIAQKGYLLVPAQTRRHLNNR